MGFWGNRVGKIAGLERRAEEAGEKGKRVFFAVRSQQLIFRCFCSELRSEPSQVAWVDFEQLVRDLQQVN